jgi:hypothetical protein
VDNIVGIWSEEIYSVSNTHSIFKSSSPADFDAYKREYTQSGCCPTLVIDKVSIRRATVRLRDLRPGAYVRLRNCTKSGLKIRNLTRPWDQGQISGGSGFIANYRFNLPLDFLIVLIKQIWVRALFPCWENEHWL